MIIDPNESLEEKVLRYETALKKIQTIATQIYQASLAADLAGEELSASSFAFALGACLGEVAKALGKERD